MKEKDQAPESASKQLESEGNQFLKAPAFNMASSPMPPPGGNGNQAGPIQKKDDPSDNGPGPGGTRVGKIGLVKWDGSPTLRLRSSRSATSSDNIKGFLPFNERLTVDQTYPDGWYYVTTESGLQGYVASTHIAINLPEPNAKLHRVEAGRPGYAIAIAEQYYKAAARDWGQDLRFYVNVLAHINHIPVPNNTSGWKDVSFQPGHFIWIPSQPFARSLVGVVNSGSISYNALDAVGLAGVVEAVGQKIHDFDTAITLSKKYIGKALAAYGEQAIVEALKGLAMSLVLGAALLAVTTAIGAALGAIATFFVGGAGAAPGAAAGFEVGLALLEWLGLAFLVKWAATKIAEVGSAFGTFLSTVWHANGDAKKLDNGAIAFADAIGRLMGAVIEGLIMFGAAKGIGKLFSSMRGTKAGKTFEQGPTGRWLQERVSNVSGGKNMGIKSPSALLNPNVMNFRGLKDGKVSELLSRVPPSSKMRVLHEIPGKVSEGVEYTWIQDGVNWKCRIHGPDASVAPNLNAGKGWIFRIQQGNKYMDSNGTMHPLNALKNDPILANDTHIPINVDVAPSGLSKAHPGVPLVPTPIVEETDKPWWDK